MIISEVTSEEGDSDAPKFKDSEILTKLAGFMREEEHHESYIPKSKRHLHF